MTNKDKLISAGFKLLKEKGNDKFSLREVSRACNLSHNTPYKYFKNKEEYFINMGLIALKSLEESLSTKNLNEESINNIVKHICQNYLNYFIENPDHLIFFTKYGESVIFKNNEIKASENHNFIKIKKILFSEYENEEMANQRALLLWNFTHGLMTMLIEKKIKFPNQEDLDNYLNNSIKVILGNNNGSHLSKIKLTHKNSSI